MLKIFIDWEKEVNDFLADKNSSTSAAKILDLHREKISQLQHERLIHLLVMLFVALFGLICILFTIISQESGIIILDIIFMVLTVFYVLHYFDLENTTQRWYKLLEKVRGKNAN